MQYLSELLETSYLLIYFTQLLIALLIWFKLSPLQQDSHRG